VIAVGRTLRLLAALAALAMPLAAVAEPIGHAVPTTWSEVFGLTDMVVDERRNMLYFTDGPWVKRVNLSTNAFEGPIYVNGVLTGLDLSPDGNTLAVADKAMGLTRMWVHLVDLNTGKVRRVTTFKPRHNAGSFRVAWLGDGTLVVSSVFNGVGRVPLRRYQPGNDTWTVLQDSLPHRTHVAVTGDGKTLFWADGASTDGEFGRFVPATGAQRTDGRNGCPGFALAANYDGSLFAITCADWPYTSIRDANFNEIGYFSGGPVAWAPVRNIAYVFGGGSPTVKAYDMANGTPVAEYDMGDLSSVSYEPAATLRVSRDGSMLMAWSRFGHAVRYHRLYAPLAAAPVQATTPAGAPKTIALAGSIGIPATLTYSLNAPPAHGTAVVADNQATYTPAAGFHGTDTFYYRVHYGMATAAALVTVVVP
jgi:hypothetical protein